jgi:hypothetical protein
VVRFRYTPTFEDWRALNRHVWLKQFRLLIVVASVVLFCFVALPFAHRLVGRDVGLWETYKSNIGALWLPGVVAFLLGAVYYGIYRGWRTRADVREEREFVIDEHGVSVAGTSFSGSLDWQHLKEADVVRGLVMLKTKQNAFYYFPRRLIADWPAFQSLVSEHVKPTRRFRRDRAAYP